MVRNYKSPLSIETVNVDIPRSTEVRVRMVGTGICHTDMVFREGDGFALPAPCVLGHEGAGVVESVGAAVTELIPGDHVVLSFHSCRTCPNCIKKLPAYCFNLGPLNYSGGRNDSSSPISQGGQKISAAFFNQSSFATYAIADQRNTVRVPKDVPLEILGPLGCGVQTGAGAAINSLRLAPGDSLAIFGGGGVGLSALLGALAVGAGPVIVIEPNETRGKLALELGAAHVINPMLTGDVLAEIKRLSGGGVTHALDTTGLPSVVAVAAESMTFNGTLGLLGVPPVEASLPMNMFSMLVRGAGAKYIVEGDADPQIFIPQMIDLYKKGRFPFDRLITKFPFEEINQAMHAAESGAVIKPVLIF
ncbi:MAG: NAD(P)-dependent alcohol dehydrogenase [Paraburkholderia sp.]|uniref:NAD(P)-dependent alcohol dehydrogenase n=1 Tax=Paraburkholderia sp. TaxID=1926495 RepID=UPI0020B13188